MWNTCNKAVVSGDSKAASHYQLLSQQPIEIMQTLFSADEFRGFLWGNVIKYALRYGHKDERRKLYYRSFTMREWGDVHNYDVCLDSGRLGLDACVDALVALVRGE